MVRHMKAIVFTRYGNPDHLALMEVPDPEPRENELLVRVHASSVNSWDWEYLNGVPFANRLMFGLFKPKPGKQRLGADIAGVVEATGAKVTRFHPGDQVFGDLWDAWGGFAELACIRETEAQPKPANLTYEQAASVPQAGVLALAGIRHFGRSLAGQKVLINGAGGGVGAFAIQLAKMDGAEVTGVDAPHKLEAIQSFGADHTLDYTRVDFTATGRRYDLIIDCNFSRSQSNCLQVLNPAGKYAAIGGDAMRLLPVLLREKLAHLLPGETPFHLVMEGPNKGLDYLSQLLEAGRLVPRIDTTFPLKDVPMALSYFGTGQHKGKIAISVSE